MTRQSRLADEALDALADLAEIFTLLGDWRIEWFSEPYNGRAAALYDGPRQQPSVGAAAHLTTSQANTLLALELATEGQ